MSVSEPTSGSIYESSNLTLRPESSGAQPTSEDDLHNGDSRGRHSNERLALDDTEYFDEVNYP